MSFTVLAVCTGNICRSPATEALLRSALDSSVTLASAGTNALVGYTMPPPMVRLLEADGVSMNGFAARQLTPEIISEADLVLASTTSHRAWIVDRGPAAVRHTLTLRELGRLVSTLPPGALDAAALPDDAARLRELVRLALLERPKHAGRTHDDDVVDPYGRSDRTYRASYDQILDALTSVMAVLRA